jgi:hypothetical protein
MSGRLARFDLFGHLSAPYLVQTWIGMLLCLHGVWMLIALGLGGPDDVPYFAGLAALLVLAAVCSHPAAKTALLGAWVLWWAYRFARSPGFHAGLVVLLSMSL